MVFHERKGSPWTVRWRWVRGAMMAELLLAGCARAIPSQPPTTPAAEALERVKTAHELLDREAQTRRPGYRWSQHQAEHVYNLAADAARALPERSGARLVYVRLAARGMMVPVPSDSDVEAWLAKERAINGLSKTYKTAEAEWAERKAKQAEIRAEEQSRKEKQRAARAREAARLERGEELTEIDRCSPDGSGPVIIVPPGPRRIQVFGEGDASIHLCERRAECKSGGEAYSARATVLVDYDAPTAISCRSRDGAGLQVLDL